MAKGPGVVTGRYGTLGQVFYIEGDYWPLNTALYVSDFKGNDPRFVSYLLRTLDFLAYSDKAAVPGLNRNHLHEARVTLPEQVEEQRAIASILGSIESKIALNQKMSTTLESIAQSLFKSWFVDFDPVRAKLNGRDSGLSSEIADLFPDSFDDLADGEIPHNWQWSNLGEAINIFDSKRVPLSSGERETRKGPYPYYGATSIMDYVDDYIFTGVHLLIGEDGSVAHEDGSPFLQYVWGDFWVNNHAHVVTGKSEISTEHVYLCLKQTNVRPYVTGAVQLKINQGNLFRIPFIRPTEEISRVFSDLVGPIFARIRGLIDEVKTLIAIRDALAPKLISGQFLVSDFKRAMELV